MKRPKVNNTEDPELKRYSEESVKGGSPGLVVTQGDSCPRGH